MDIESANLAIGDGDGDGETYEERHARVIEETAEKLSLEVARQKALDDADKVKVTMSKTLANELGKMGSGFNEIDPIEKRE